ncbi:MAG: GxxExxY protein, partial [Candidatus Marinimicrobia bacterium]|nr:GxxExxY protein [Candidatus Neomarinimicrobiota bacterium]
HGYAEKVYQKAVAQGLRDAGLKFLGQVYSPVMYNGKRVGSNYFDFLIEGKVVLELKKGKMG